MLVGCQYAEPTDYILKWKNRGWYAIVYDCKNGAEKSIQNGRVQYVFPENRILFVNHPIKFGIVENRFFYYENGKKIKFNMPVNEDSVEDFVVWGPSQVNNGLFNKTIFYFGSQSDKTDKDFENFVYYVDRVISEKGFKCKANRIARVL